MIEILDKEKITKIIGDRLLTITVVEGCCGYALKTSLSEEKTDGEIEFDGLRFLVSEETIKIAPTMSIEIGQTPKELIVKNLAAKSYCGCGRSFAI